MSWTKNKVLYLQIIICVMGDSLSEESTMCAYFDDQKEHERTRQEYTQFMLANDDSLDDGGLGTVLPDNKTMRCPTNKKKCFTMWIQDPKNKTNIKTLKQGCWNPGKGSCSSAECVNRTPPMPNRDNNTKYCCCEGNMCNVNVSDAFVPGMYRSTLTPAVTATYRYVHDASYRERTVIISLSAVFAVAMVILLSFLTYRCCLRKQQPPLDSLNLVEAPPPTPTPSIDLDDLKISSRLSKGRYGEVYKGLLGEMEVAVKVFNQNQKQYFFNERDIYTLPFMDHQNIIKYYGSDERLTCEGTTQYLLVMNYIPNGSLSNYLKENVISWSSMCKICHSVAAGLAHLHSDITQGDKFKPAIGHRDVNTRNILVRSNLECVLCDMGFAMKIMGSKFFRNGQQENAEQASLSDVGTPRYMAPEVLDGAVNLRDCESSLKQIDVYALGLVLWEIASRCSDLYQGLPVPEYQLPFQKEVGVHPSFEEMQLLVSRNKQRPVFPDVWKDTNHAIRALKETIEDCWDQDAEARLTSLCVEERITDMAQIWENRHKGFSPSVPLSAYLPMASQLTNLEEKTDVQHNIMSEHPPTAHLIDTANPESQAAPSYVRDGELSEPALPVGKYTRFSRGENSLSTSTVETTLSPSDSEPILAQPVIRDRKDDVNLNFEKTNKLFQPHQGRNPTVERNTHKSSDEELAIMGNTLVREAEQGKEPPPVAPRSERHTSAHTSTFGGPYGVHEADFEPMNDNMESSSLVQYDTLSHHRNSSIPLHIQNEVHPVQSVRPKQANLPGNGASNTNTQSKSVGNPNETRPKKHRFPMFNLKHLKDLGKTGLQFLSKSHQNIESVNQSQCEGQSQGQPADLPARGQGALGHHRSNSDGTSDTAKSNLYVKPREPPISTEIRMVNGSPVVRPTSLPIKRPTNHQQLPEACPLLEHTADDSRSPVPLQENRLGIAEVGIAKLQHSGHSSGHPAVLKTRRVYSQSTSDLSPSGSHANSAYGGSLQTINVTKPLPSRPREINGNHVQNSDSEDFENNNGPSSKPKDRSQQESYTHTDRENCQQNVEAQSPSEKIRKRVRTPYQLKTGRFSLCNDRIMFEELFREDFSGVKASQSVQQFSSLGLGMDAV